MKKRIYLIALSAVMSLTLLLSSCTYIFYQPSPSSEADVSSLPSINVSSDISEDVSDPSSDGASSSTSSHTPSAPSEEPESNPSSDIESRPSVDVSSDPSSEASSRPSSEVSSRPSSEVSSRPSSEASSRPSSEASSVVTSDPSSETSSVVTSSPSSEASSGNTSSGDDTQDIFTPITQSQYYYRSKLNSAERALYDAIVSASKSYSASITLPSPSSSETASKVLTYFYLDHPENFWWGRSYTLHTSGGRVIRLTMNMLYSEAEIKQMQKEIDEAVEDIFKKIPKNASDFDIEKVFHDSLINGAEYVIPSNDPKGETVNYSLYGVLVKGEGVCESYSEAFQYLCNMAGIPCFGITGEASGGGHKWNGVKIDGSWYLMDVTWDDPTGGTPVCRYYYFNVTEEMISDSHVADSDLISLLPAFTATKDNFYSHYGLICDLESLDETVKNALDFFEETVSGGKFTIELRAVDEDTAQDCYDTLSKNYFKKLNSIVNEYNSEKGTNYRFTSYYDPSGCYLKFVFTV